jgi:mannose-1-phosphate guanylyltransferase
VEVVLPTPPGIAAGDTGVGTVMLEQPQREAEAVADAGMWGVVLAGGIGSRFWPLSTPERPKQLLSLVGERPLIAETVARLSPLIPPERVLVVTSRDIAGAIHAAIRDVPAENMLVEPRPLGTAAALAWAAHEIARRAGPETLFCCMHADLAVGFPELFRQVVRQAARLAASSPVLVTVGVKPTRPETSFGYLKLGVPLPTVDKTAAGSFEVETVIDRPGAALAETLIADGALWNAGIFVWRASVVRDAIAECATELAPGLEALDRRDFDGYAASIQSVSIERGVLARSNRVITVLGDFQWDDVGTWASLRRARELDDTGNGALGTVHFVESASNVVHSESGTVVLYGCSHLLVVVLDGLTFVTPLDRATDLKALLDALPTDVRINPGS